MNSADRKKVIVLGSTGSIGRQTLEVIREQGYELTGVSANDRINILEEQIRLFHPRFCAVRNEEKARLLKVAVQDMDTIVLSGEAGLIAMCEECPADIAENSILGAAGILPTLALIRRGLSVAMANKEPIVAAGEMILEEAKKHNAKIIPVDSEHSAIFQCLSGSFNDHAFIQELVLTASGGPFFGKSLSFLEGVTPEMAVAHPVWSMGKKISVDSATLMNKGLELIEAVRLFSVAPEQVSVTVHRQSIVHSMVSFVDGSTLAQMGHPDMRHCIQFALTWPVRTPGLCKTLDFKERFNLTFEPVDDKTFPLISVARLAVQNGPSFTTVLNAANEAAVSLFLNRKISFTDIFRIVSDAVENHNGVSLSSVDAVVALDRDIKRHIFDRF